MEIKEQTGTANTTVSKGRQIKYIVVHYTAGITSKPGTAVSTAKYFSKETTKASADYIVDDNYVVLYNPDIKNRYTWHCGGGKYKTKGGSLYKICTSANSIGIELCSMNNAKKVTSPNDNHWYFTTAVTDNAVELVKSLMEEYGIDVEHVIRHYDVNGKPCPGIVGWNEDTGDISEWVKFKEALIDTPECETEPSEDIVVEEPEPVKEVIPPVQETRVSADVKVIEKSVTSPVKKEKTGLFEQIIAFIVGLFKK